jgi:hypothetical protein
VYHLELRQFPHNLCRFNLTEGQLRAVVEPWVREQVLELGERKWNPQQARLTIIEGPQLENQQLSMGRGWRAAEREGEEVTERILTAAKAAVQRASAQPAAQAAAPTDPLALGVQLAALLGADPARLLAAWREVLARRPGLPPSETLALAEREIADSASDPR